MGQNLPNLQRYYSGDFDRSHRWSNILIEFLPAILQKDFADDSKPLAKFARDIDCIKYV
jgi:hypothetical protein